MKLYFNDDDTYIDIKSYEHQIRFLEEKQETYNIILNSTEDIHAIASEYEDVVIEEIKITDDVDNVLMTKHNLQLKLDMLSETLDNNGALIFIWLTNT